MRIAAEDRS